LGEEGVNPPSRREDNMTYFLGIGTSTTSSKSVLITKHNGVVAVASSAHNIQTPPPLWSEHNPQEWWEAVSASIQRVLGRAGSMVMIYL
jgi:xylulokinase